MAKEPKIIKVGVVEKGHISIVQQIEKQHAVVIHFSGRNPMKRYSSFKNITLSILTGIVFAGLFSFGVYVSAIPPTSKYSPGDTLDPSCTVGSTNCTVLTPVTYTGASAAVDLGSQNLTTTGTVTGGTTTQLKYNSTNYTTLTAASNGDLTVATTSATTGGDINLNSAVTGDATILGSTGTLVLGGTGNTNNESLKFDFETSSNKVAVTSSTGLTDIDLGSLNLISTGTLTLGGTTGTLVTRVKAGAATESDTNGSLVVDSTNGRLYFRYGSAWHYVAQTAGFQIPDFETIDPISGDQIKEGDIVLGMINKTFEDKALHGVWVKWDSVKAELLQEIKDSVGVTSDGGWASGSPSAINSISGVNTATLLDKITNVIASLGITIKDGVTNITNLVTEKFSAKTARIERLEMVDKATGDIYCTWVESGDWQKAKGECGSVDVAIAGSQLSQQTNETIQQAAQQAAQQAVQQVTEQVQNQVQQEVQSQIQEQIQNQQIPSPVGQNPASSETSPIPFVNSDQSFSNNSENSENGLEKAPEESKNEQAPSSKHAVPVEIPEQSFISEEQEMFTIPETAPTPQEQIPVPASPEQSVVPLIIEDLAQQAAADLSQRMGEFITWIFQQVNVVSIKRSSDFLMEPLKTVWIFNPVGLMQQGTADLSQSFKKIKYSSSIIGKETTQNLQKTSEIISQYEYTLGRYAISLLEPLNAIWIFNPAGLINYGALDLYNTSKKIENMLSPVNFIGINTVIQSTSDATKKSLAGITFQRTEPFFMEPLRNIWIFNPLTLVQYGVLDVYRMSKGMQRFSVEVGKTSAQNLQTTLSVIFQYENKLGKYSASLLEPFNAIWIFNPTRLINYGVLDISKRLEGVQSFILNIEASITPTVNF